MKARILLPVAMTFALTAPVFAQGAAGAKAKSPASAASRLVVMPAADLTWTDLDPTGAPGVKIATLWGDATKGAYGAFFKLPAGFAVPLHTHTHNIRSSSFRGDLYPGSGRKAGVPDWAGVYFLQPGGDYATPRAATRPPNVVLSESNGNFDLKLVAGERHREELVSRRGARAGGPAAPVLPRYS